MPEFINDCCVDEGAMDFKTGEHWSDSIAVLVGLLLFLSPASVCCVGN